MSTDQVKAMVLAAGAGTRLHPLTATLPKPLVPVANMATMEHIVRLLKRHHITDIAANIYHLADQIPEYFAHQRDLGVNLHFVAESKLSGDAGGVRACRSFLDGGPFVVIMGDIITDVDLSYLIDEHKRKGALVSIGLQEVDDVTHFGIATLDHAGFITSFKEKPKAQETDSNLASTGIYVLDPEVFNLMPSGPEVMFGKQMFPLLLNMDLPMLGVRLPGYWSDIGTMDSYRKTSFDAIDNLIDISLPASSVCNPYTSLIGKNVVMHPDVEIIGHAIIGDNCVIESGCVLEDSIIWANSTIGANTHLQKTIVGTNCSVSPDSLCQGMTIVDSEPVLAPVRLKTNSRPASRFMASA